MEGFTTEIPGKETTWIGLVDWWMDVIPFHFDVITSRVWAFSRGAGAPHPKDTKKIFLRNYSRPLRRAGPSLPLARTIDSFITFSFVLPLWPQSSCPSRSYYLNDDRLMHWPGTCKVITRKWTCGDARAIDRRIDFECHRQQLKFNRAASIRIPVFLYHPNTQTDRLDAKLWASNDLAGFSRWM